MPVESDHLQRGKEKSGLSRAKGVKIPPRRPLTPESKRVVSRPPVNRKRAAVRQARREAMRQTAKDLHQNRPHAGVRPAGAPRKIMPKTPAPASSAARFSTRKSGSLPSAARVSARVAAGTGAAAMAAFGLLALNASAAHPTLSAEATSLKSSLDDLQDRSAFHSISEDITRLDSDLERVAELLESARQAGYVYQSDLEELLYDAMSDWEKIRPQVVSAVQQHAQGLQNQLAAINPMVQSLNARLPNPVSAEPLLRNTQTQVNRLLDRIADSERDLQNRYSKTEAGVRDLHARLRDIHWAMDQLEQAKFKPNTGEELVMAVPARWDKEGKDDPEGVLFLTNERLLFEQKEKVATKKVLFITTASELVHEVLIDQALERVDGVEGENKGLFGHKDFLLIDFDDKDLHQTTFHLDGQDSKDWAGLVKRAASGQIEKDRTSSSSALSMGDLTGPLSSADIMAVQSEINALQDDVMLRAVRQELSELENEVRSLERKLVDVRGRGYEIEKSLEADVAVLVVQWERTKTNAEKTLEFQSNTLNDQMQAIQQSVARLVSMSGNLSAAKPLYMQVKSSIASAEAQADAAEATVLAQYDEYAEEVEGLSAHLEWIDWMLEALSGASFRLQATESGISAVEALYQPPYGEPENGILFLTDQRLLWEDRVGTYELKVDVPLTEILDVEMQADPQSKREALLFKFGAQAPSPLAKFELASPVGEEWLQMIGRARSGGYVRDRAVEIPPEELERIRNAPQQCSNCGAPYTAPLLRGQTEIRCSYCGHVVRI
jgi:predicted  nucleic acid-binding Zn-ribbon protein